MFILATDPHDLAKNRITDGLDAQFLPELSAKEGGCALGDTTWTIMSLLEMRVWRKNRFLLCESCLYEMDVARRSRRR